MQLSELLNYDRITIQCHDNPDPDALASGMALYSYFKHNGKQARFIYSGKFQIRKSNLVLMIEKLNIPVEFESPSEDKIDGLLVTVDSCYGEGNITRFNADCVAVIDHHQTTSPVKLAEINPKLGSCSTLVWKMMQDVDYDISSDKPLNTALYYGLMTDTGSFSELHHPLDRDMQDALVYDKSLINLFCNSNFSIDDMVIAGKALINYTFLEPYKCSIIHAAACDPNILGLISDLTLQVDRFNVCIVFNELNDGYKLSVRSCTKEVRANEFAAFITAGIGSGGGHINKAGGFISKASLHAKYPDDTFEKYLSDRVKTYFDLSLVIDTRTYTPDITGTRKYIKKKFMLGYVDPADFLPHGANVMIRAIEGDATMTIDNSFYIMIGPKGEVYPVKKEKFEKAYTVSDEPYSIVTEYVPTLHCHSNGSIYKLDIYAHTCYANGGAQILARKCNRIVKIFTPWYDESYMLGNPDDYFACRADDHADIYIIENEIFHLTYDPVE